MSETEIFCEHANEVPLTCKCDRDCYCKKNGSCKQKDNWKIKSCHVRRVRLVREYTYYDNLQDAMDDANEGDTIEMLKGTQIISSQIKWKKE